PGLCSFISVPQCEFPLDGQAVPGLCPAAITLQVDTADFDECEQKCLTRKLLSTQYLAEGGTPKPDPPQASIRQMAPCMNSLPFKISQARLTSMDVQLL